MPTNLLKYGVARPLLAGLALAALALWLRHGVLEAGVLPRDCTAADAPALACLFKQAFVHSFLDQRIGWVSLVAGVLAFVRASRGLAWGGLAVWSGRPGAVQLRPGRGRRPTRAARAGASAPAARAGPARAR
jgi:hypothetical protein